MYIVEAIDNQKMITIVVNRKEYLKKYKNKNVNKKHKGMRKGAANANFDSCTKRILSLNGNETLNKNPERKIQKHFQIENGMMKMKSIKMPFSETK